MLLTLLTFLPLLGILGLLVLPADRDDLARAAAFTGSLVVAAVAAIVWFRFDPQVAERQLGVEATWFRIPASTGAIEVRFALGVDGLSLLFVVATAGLVPLVIAASHGTVREGVRRFLGCVFAFQSGVTGFLLASDVVLGLLFGGLLLLATAALIGTGGMASRTSTAGRAARALARGGVLWTIVATWLVVTYRTTSLPELAELTTTASTTAQGWSFAAVVVACASLLPLVPFHGWVVDAQEEAPPVATALLVGSLAPIGIYALLRFGFELFPVGAVAWAPALAAVGAIGVVYAATLALAQSDLQRVVACTAIAQMSLVVLGASGLNGPGLTGGLVQGLGVGLAIALLFVLVGMLVARRGSSQLDAYGGVAAVVPMFAASFGFAVLTLLGLPGTATFAGAWWVWLGAFEAFPVWTVVAGIGWVLVAAALLRALRRVLFGEVVHEGTQKLRDVNGREVSLLAPLALALVAIGIAPGRASETTSATVRRLVDRIEEVRRAAELDEEQGRATPDPAAERAR